MVVPRRLAGLSSAPPGSALPSDLLASAAARLYPSMDAEGDGDRAPRATPARQAQDKLGALHTRGADSGPK